MPWLVDLQVDIASDVQRRSLRLNPVPDAQHGVAPVPRGQVQREEPDDVPAEARCDHERVPWDDFVNSDRDGGVREEDCHAPRTAVTMASSTAFVLISAASDDDDDR